MIHLEEFFVGRLGFSSMWDDFGAYLPKKGNLIILYVPVEGSILPLTVRWILSFITEVMRSTIIILSSWHTTPLHNEKDKKWHWFIWFELFTVHFVHLPVFPVFRGLCRVLVTFYYFQCPPSWSSTLLKASCSFFVRSRALYCLPCIFGLCIVFDTDCHSMQVFEISSHGYFQ